LRKGGASRLEPPESPVRRAVRVRNRSVRLRFAHMSAVVEKPSKTRKDFLTADADFGWRVLGLLNLFRLALAAILLVGFILVDEPRLVGDVHPALAWRALIGMLVVGCVEMWCLYKRSPSIERQAPF